MLDIINIVGDKYAKTKTNKTTLDEFKLHIQKKYPENYQNSYNYSKNDQYEVYKYECELLLIPLTKIIIISLLSLLFNTFVNTIIAMIIFLLYRRQVGGFHFSTYIRCLITSIILINGIGVLAEYIKWNATCTYIIIIFSLIFCLIPVLKNRTALCYIALFVIVSIVICELEIYKHSIAIVLGLNAVTFSINNIGVKVFTKIEKSINNITENY